MNIEIQDMADYHKTYSSFRWQIPEWFNFGFDIIDKQAKENDKLALLSVDNSGEYAQYHTFRDLSILSTRMANLLKTQGIKRGDRIIIMLPSVPEWYIAVLGVIKLAAIFSPTPTLSTAGDLEYRINQLEAVAVITNSELVNRFTQIRERCPSLKAVLLTDGEKKGCVSLAQEMPRMSSNFNQLGRTRRSDALLIYFTSGTTGYPKMVLHNQAYALAHIVTAKFVHDLKSTDLHWTIADTGWAKTAWGRLFGQWILGAAVFQHNNKGKFDAVKTMRLIEKYAITTFCAPPTAYRMLVQEDLKSFNLKSLRHCVSAGEPLNPAVYYTWKEKVGLGIYDCYGQTESVCLIGNYPSLPVKPGSMGKPTPGHVINILDDEGSPLPSGKQGKIALKIKPVRPPGLFREYWKDTDSMKTSFRGDWYYTGDLAIRDEEGYFWFVGREDDVIKSSGYRIGPFEVESVLQEHPAVAESTVIGVPDDQRGQVVKAYVVLKPGYVAGEALTKELQEFVKNSTAPYKYPREIEYLKELPKTISGKILRSELRQRK
ncbi:acyl-CoA synthetase [Chloroflexota bacterium]